MVKAYFEEDFGFSPACLPENVLPLISLALLGLRRVLRQLYAKFCKLWSYWLWSYPQVEWGKKFFDHGKHRKKPLEEIIIIIILIKQNQYFDCSIDYKRKSIIFQSSAQSLFQSIRFTKETSVLSKLKIIPFTNSY